VTRYDDPIELEVFRHLFAAIAEEMGQRLMRSAYSPNIKERRDFSCALFDQQGDMIAQAAHIPVHLGSAPLSVQACVAAFDAITDGDRFILNDPFAGGTHLPDITVVAACVIDGRRFFVASRAHHADVGGKTPGSLPIGTHIDDEGYRLGPTRVTEAVLDDICRASRTPDERRGDLQAQLAAVRCGVDRLRDLCGRHGAEAVAGFGEALQRYTERRIRAIIQSVPDGTYRFEDVLDDDGHDRRDIAIRCALTIAGDAAAVDLSGSDDQTPGPVNAVRAITMSAVMYVLRCLGPADLPSNSGVLRPVKIVTRPGSVVDALYPAAVAGGNVETSQRIVDVLLGALAHALPGVIPAASCGSMNNLLIGGRDFAYYETIAGGAGAGPRHDGESAIHTHMTNTLNTPVEAIEHAYPFRVERYAIRDGSGGRGRHRGGDGVIRTYLLDTPAEVTMLTERRQQAPYGLQGGLPAAPGRNRITTPNGDTRELPAKSTFDAPAGTRITIETPGGGGWSQPAS
jgi:N-methylhydantoinase B